MESSGEQSGVGGSHGQMFVGSDSHLVKCQRIGKKKRVERRTGASEGGSEPHQLKRKRVKKEVFSWFQRRPDASQRSEHCQAPNLEHKRFNKEYAERVNRAIAAASQRKKAEGSEHRPNLVRRDRVNGEGVVPGLDRYIKDMYRNKAKKALELYEKSQDAEFEIVEVFYSHGSKLAHPETKSKQVWSHVSFTAKPKNVECSPKHFFGELLRDESSLEFNAAYCSTFEPSDDSGFDHGCIFCPSDEKFHPADGYCVGRPPWYLPRVLVV